MTLSNYHQRYTSYSDAEIQNRINEKKNELATIFEKVPLKTPNEIVRIAVLGCGDKRFVKYHKEIFENAINKPVEIITFDITIDHLEGEENVIQHDCTLPLPNGPFDITYAHVLLRFIETKKQWDLMYNSYSALNAGGLAIHVLDKEDYETKKLRLPNGLFSVPLEQWKTKLTQLGATYHEVPIKFGVAFIIIKQ